MIVSLIIVAHNEEKYLQNLFEEISNQTYDHKKIEILLIDSMSTDNTLQIFEKFKKNSDFLDVKILMNEQKFLPQGCNIALDNFEGDIFLRIDAHSSIPKDFIEKNVIVINSGEYICGGARPNIIEDETNLSNVLLNIENAMFGSGIANYRNSNGKKEVSSIFHGAYRKEVFEKIGKYDESLHRTEDNDMSYRIRANGYRIIYDPSIISYQYTRPTVLKMLKQKYLNGYWIGKTIKKNPKIFSFFHFVPALFVISLFISIILSYLLKNNLYISMLFVPYLGVLTITTIALMMKTKSVYSLLAPFILFLLHFLYGIGTILGILSRGKGK